MALSGRLGVLEGCRALRALDLGRVRLSLPFCIEAWPGLAHSQSRQFLRWFVLEARWSLPLLGFAIALLPYTWSFSGGLCSVLSLWVLLEWELVEGAASLLTSHCCVSRNFGWILGGLLLIRFTRSGVSGRWCGPPARLSYASEAADGHHLVVLPALSEPWTSCLLSHWTPPSGFLGVKRVASREVGFIFTTSVYPWIFPDEL